MRYLYIIDKSTDINVVYSKAIALGCTEIVSGVPQNLKSYVDKLPCVVIESSNVPYHILSVLYDKDINLNNIRGVIDLPKPENMQDILSEVNDIKQRLQKAEKDISSLKSASDIEPIK